MNPSINHFLSQVKKPHLDSHKGQNGKLLIIGGSELFHAASKWSLDVASKFVDMVFYSSVPINNELIKEAKGEFWNGIVVPRSELENYLSEADCILIGPGMERQEGLESRQVPTTLTEDDWQHDTAKVTNYLLAHHPDKRWVIDAGALQMVIPELLSDRCIITPHQGELKRLLEGMGIDFAQTQEVSQLRSQLSPLLEKGVTILLKGVVDLVFFQDQMVDVEGGNPGMTKGGTGDVLAGLVAALYCQHDPVTSAVVASYLNKKAGEKLAQRVGPNFNASDLVEAIPKVFWELGQNSEV